MGRALALILAVFWTVVFGSASLASVAELAQMSAPMGPGEFFHLFRAVASALVSSLFLWLAIAAIADLEPADMTDLAATAVAGACIVATLRTAWLGGVETSTMMQLPGLLATYLAVAITSGRILVERAGARTVTRLMASDAANVALLSRQSSERLAAGPG